MALHVSLYSRVSPGKSSPKKVRGFLALPGEIRNQIYGYYFESDFRCEVVAQGTSLEAQMPKTVKLWAANFQTTSPKLQHATQAKEEKPTTIRVSRRLGKYNTVQGLQTKWSTSLFAISLVCKLLHTETLPCMYRKTAFVFDAPKRITAFMALVPEAMLEHITVLELVYATYGAPAKCNDRIWQQKHIKSWNTACRLLSKRLTRLRVLTMHVKLNNDTPRFNLRETCFLPLLQFRRLGHQQHAALTTVNVDFRTPCLGSGFRGPPSLVQANVHLHKLFATCIQLAILGEKENMAMAGFDEAWEGRYHVWQHHLGFARTGW
ncbi:hypothetical protein ACEQ8H_004905 [Pleosporales sp. CAS-2024a]